MNWISQNWIWIVFAVGVLFLLTRRGGMGCGMGGHHSHAQDAGGSRSAEGGGESGAQAQQQRNEQHAGHRGC